MYKTVLLLVLVFTVLGSVSTAQAQTRSFTNSCGFPGQACCTFLQPGSATRRATPILPGPISGLASIPGYTETMDGIMNFIVGGLNNAFFSDVNFDRCFASSPITSSGVCTCEAVAPKGSSYTKISALCNIFYNAGTDIAEMKSCNECAEKYHGFYTGIGCVPLSLPTFVTSVILGPVIGLVGLIAFGTILYAAFILQTSQGNPEKTKKAKELLSASIVGLIFIILSVFIMRVIGVNVLGLPGFSL